VRWLRSEAAGEGLRSVWYGRGIAVALLLSATWGAIVPAVLDAVMVQALVDDERAWVAAGGRVLVATHASSDGVDRRRCEQLGNLEGVIAVGSLSRSEGTVRTTSAPSDNVALVSLTPGAWQLLGGVGARRSPLAADVGVLAARAERWGLRDGSYIVLSETEGLAPGSVRGDRGLGASDAPGVTDPLRVFVVPSGLIGEEFSGLFLRVAPEGGADACYVALGARYYEPMREALPAILASEGEPAQVAERLHRGAFFEDYASRYEARATRWGAAGAGVVIGAVWLFVGWARRSVRALYVTLGFERRELIYFQGAEWAVVAAFAVVVGWGSAVLIASALGVPVVDVAPSAARSIVGTLLVASGFVCVGFLMPVRSVVEDLKDR